MQWTLFGITRINAVGTAIGLFKTDGNVFGADISGGVSSPTQPDGEWAFLQTVRPTNVYGKKSDDTCLRLDQNDKTCLDGGFPYPGTEYYPVGFDLYLRDSPQMFFNELKALKGEFRFNTYVMYRPKIAESQWVSLKRAFWKYWFCGGKVDGQWTFDIKGQQNDAPESTASHPIWVEMSNPNKSSSAPCPSPFCP